MPFLNPRADFAFKRIFGSESDTSRLISLLNAVLQAEGEKRIAEIEILNPYNAPRIPLLKDSYLDIRARDAGGKYYLIEMQVANVEGMQKRVLYNACKQYGNQLDQGEDYLLLNDVIGITFTNFVLFDQKADLRSSFMLRDESGDVYSDDLELVFIELPKFKVGKDQLQQLGSTLDKWLYFLKYADGLETRPREFDHDQTLRSAFDAANIANLNKRELELYEDSLKIIRDQHGRIAYALNKGRREGREEGRVEGRAEGKAEGKAEGREEGIQIGREEGLQEGLSQGKQEGLRRAATALAQRGLSLAEIANALDIDEFELRRMLD